MTTPSHATPHDTVRADVEIAATPDEVFRALTDPEQLAAWWGSDDTYRTNDWEVDARPGGEWSVRTTDSAGNEGTVRGEYIAVDAPRLLEFTWRASWDDGGPTRVRYELTPENVRGVSGTRLVVTHSGFGGAAAFAAAGVADAAGWARALEARVLRATARDRLASPVIASIVRSTRYRRRPARAVA